MAHRPRHRLARGRLTLVVVVALAAGFSCAPKAIPRGGELGFGFASFYGEGFDGKLTASGEKFDRNKFTAAHKMLPFGTCVRVTAVESGRSAS